MEETEWEEGRKGGREGKSKKIREGEKGKGVKRLTYLRSNETETNGTRHRGWKTRETIMLIKNC